MLKLRNLHKVHALEDLKDNNMSKKVHCQAVAAVAGHLTPDGSGDWNIFSEECLREVAEKNPDKFKFEDGKLITTISIDEKYLNDRRNNCISMGCSTKFE